MSVPPFASAFVGQYRSYYRSLHLLTIIDHLVTMFSAWISDRYHCRGLVTMFSCTLCVIGFAMFLGTFSLLAPHYLRSNAFCVFRWPYEYSKIWELVPLNHRRVLLSAGIINLECQQRSTPHQTSYSHRYRVYHDKLGGNSCNLAARLPLSAAAVQEGHDNAADLFCVHGAGRWCQHLLPLVAEQEKGRNSHHDGEKR